MKRGTEQLSQSASPVPLPNSCDVRLPRSCFFFDFYKPNVLPAGADAQRRKVARHEIHLFYMEYEKKECRFMSCFAIRFT